MDPYSPEIVWLVVFGFIIAFVLAFGIGANDVANSFGTSVGAGVLTIKQACWIATICEVSGSIFLGYKVSDTMRKGILDPAVYENSEQELMLGCVSSLASSAIWLLIATYFKLPISGTHSIVGSTVGFSLVARGVNGLQWKTLGTIVASWFISPVLSGAMSTLLFLAIRRFILKAANPLRVGLWCLPLFYGVTLFVNTISIVHDGPKLLHLDNIPTWIAFLGSLCFGLIVAALVQIFVVPWQRRKVLGQSKASTKPVKFSIDGGADDRSASSSPKRSDSQSRPNSLVVADVLKTLPAITENTELVSMPANGHHTNGGGTPSDAARVKNLMLGDLSTQLTNTIQQKQQQQQQQQAGYRFSPNTVERAERLLGGKTSLDNTDLTITSLHYIDEQRAASIPGIPSASGETAMLNNNGRSAATALQSYFERRSNPCSPSTDAEADESATIVCSPTADADADPSSSEAETLPVHDMPIIITTTAASPQAVAASAINGGGGRATNASSTATLRNVATAATLSPNSSKLPLIGCTRTNTSATNALALIEEPEDVSTLFSFLQVLTASFGSFVHGGNDVSNAIGPLIAIWMIYVEGSVAQKSETPLWILLFGGVGISVGLWVWGRRVIETVGNDLTKITPSTGFTIEIGAAMTVLLASKIGLPVSTTHCKVGSVVFVGYANAHRNTPAETAAGMPQVKAVDWALFRNIVYAWVVTVPVAALLSAAFMYVLRWLVL